MPRETWYVRDDGAVADPNEVAPDDAGKLRHKSGVAIAMRGTAYSSRGVDPEEERAKAKKPAGQPKSADEAAAKPAARHESRDMKPESAKQSYMTRESKAG